MKKILIIIIVHIMSFTSAFAYKYAVEDKFLQADFWLVNTKNIQKVILTSADIAKFNQENLAKIPQLADLQVFFENVSEGDVKELITNYKIPQNPRYLGEIEASDGYYQKLADNTNLANINKANFALGFTTRKTNMRSFPSHNSLYETPNDIEFDMSQETAVYSATPVVILHKSKDGNFIFVRTSNYAGWIDAQDIVYADKDSWESYIKAEDFIVITANKLMLSFNPYDSNTSQMVFYMGQKLPIIKNKPDFVDNQSTAGNFVAKIPIENSSGQLEFKLILIPYSEDVNVGYLPYTKENIIKQAFKMQGNRYDWGGHLGERDCSSFIQDIFNTFGINIPRNTGEMANMAGVIIASPAEDFRQPTRAELANSIGRIAVLEGMNEDNRNKILQKTELGTLLLMKGHVFMYLGYVGGQHYVISDIASVGGDNEVVNDKGEKGLERIAVNQVSVNTLDTVKPTGISFLNSLYKTIFVGR
ncbi:MAG: SH3 domain-containing protein [Alphaproteobacteria bacterium]|nr:SH3 domain-containing protein [Alphaproteobacteria bacterium]